MYYKRLAAAKSGLPLAKLFSRKKRPTRTKATFSPPSAVSCPWSR